MRSPWRAPTASSPAAPAPAPRDAGTALLIGYARVSTEDQRLDWDCPALVALPHFAWSRPSSLSCQVADSKMESAFAYLAVHDTLAEASQCKFRSGLQ